MKLGRGRILNSFYLAPLSDDKKTLGPSHTPILPDTNKALRGRGTISRYSFATTPLTKIYRI